MAPMWFMSEDPLKQFKPEGGGDLTGVPRYVTTSEFQSSASAQLVISAPDITNTGDLLIAQFVTHRATANIIWREEIGSRWQRLSSIRNLSGADHRMDLWYKVAEDVDAQGTGNDEYLFRITANDSQAAQGNDNQYCAVHLFRGIEEPGTSLDFLMGMDLIAEDVGTDVLLANNIDFDPHPWGEDALLACFLATDNSAISITTPAEMVEQLNKSVSGIGTVALTTELLLTEDTAFVGPKRFTLSGSTDWIGAAVVFRPDSTGTINLPVHNANAPKFIGDPAIFDSAGAVASMTFEAPSDTNLGDLLIAVIARDEQLGDTVIVDADPDGWTHIASVGAANDGWVGAWWKYATAGDVLGTGNDEYLADWTSQGTEVAKIWVQRVGNVFNDTEEGDDWLDDVGSEVIGASFNHDLPAISTITDDVLYVAAVGWNSTGEIVYGSAVQTGFGEHFFQRGKSNGSGIFIGTAFFPSPTVLTKPGGIIKGTSSIGQSENIAFGIRGPNAVIPTDANFDDVVLLLPFSGNGARHGDTTTVDSSPAKNNDITFGGGTRLDWIDFEHARFGGLSLSCPGSNDVLTVEHGTDEDFFLSTINFTVEAWVRFENPVSAQHVWGLWAATGNNKSWRFYWDFSTTELRFEMSTDGSTSLSADLVHGSFTPTTGDWYHIACDFDGTTYRLYLNGTVVDSSTTLRTLFDANTPLQLGGDGTSVDFNGALDNVRITRNVARYQGAFTPPTAPFPTRGT